MVKDQVESNKLAWGIKQRPWFKKNLFALFNSGRTFKYRRHQHVSHSTLSKKKGFFICKKVPNLNQQNYFILAKILVWPFNLTLPSPRYLYINHHFLDNLLIMALQGNLDFTKSQGTKEIGLLYREFIISSFCGKHFTVTLARLKLKYNYHSLYQGSIKSRFHCITTPHFRDFGKKLLNLIVKDNEKKHLLQ